MRRKCVKLENPLERADLGELHYITSIVNLPSILTHGILSHKRVEGITHLSVADKEVQERRSGITVPGGRPLHEYVNLYINARNAMLYRLQADHQDLCVLRVSPGVLDLPGVVIADKNAASWARFFPSPDGLEVIDGELIFREYWTDANPYVQQQNRQARQAEVLVPDMVPRRMVLGVRVSCAPAQQACTLCAPKLPSLIDRHLFFLPEEVN